MMHGLIPLAQLQPNTGKIPGLPANPRQWTKGDVDRLARSIKETPELLDARPLIVLPFGTPERENYVILGGNLRHAACKALKMPSVPCYILDETLPVSKLKEIVIKDNGAFGQWDFDQLANEWNDLPLPDWGVPSWENPDEDPPGTLDADPKMKPFVMKVTFPTAESMNRFIAAYKDVLEKDYGCTISETGGEI